MDGLKYTRSSTITHQREVDPRVRHQVGLELGEVDVEGAVEPERGGDGRDDLADEAVEIRVSRALDVQIAPADVVDGLVVDHEGAVRVFQSRVGRQDGVVGLDHCGGHLSTPTTMTHDVLGFLLFFFFK